MKITFNAFSFLQKKLSDNGFCFYNVEMDMLENSTVNELLYNLKLGKDDVEGVFVNGKISPFDTFLHDGDRVGLLPPGTPGPYRVMLGIVKTQQPVTER
ncbi:MAG: MoaD/ThiS family protein [Desulfamplus sp.]|nr:MoaD/ThiS family protein [Desulfamplus sp.]MBF0411624.1 MoaD/ThiS family protein [Desulfamplus sp.]